MKKIVVIILLLVIPLITVEKVNNKNYYLETETDTYTKEEIDNKINELLTKINDNTTKITETKNILTEIKNKLNDYALKTSLNKTNEDIENLLALANNNAKRIDELEGNLINLPEISVFKASGDAMSESYMTYSGFILNNTERKYKTITFTSTGYWRSGLSTGMNVTGWDSLDRGSGVTSTIQSAGTYTIDISNLDYPYVATKADSSVYGYGVITNISIQ